MFESKKLIKFLEESNEYSKRQLVKTFIKLFQSNGFKEYLFYPKTKETNMIEVTDKMYTNFAKVRNLKAIISAIEEEGYSEFDRTIATFLFSLSNICKQAAVQRDKNLKDKRDNGSISDKDYKRLKSELEEYLDVVDALDSTIRKIVKDDGKTLAKECSMPKKLCVMSLYNVPDIKWIDKYKIGVYLDNLLPNIYSTVDENAESITWLFGKKLNEYSWDKYFKVLFGKENAIEVASFILLEGVSRINKYKTKAVHECWDSLTEYALETLDKAPEQMRDHMVELYIKRIESMFANKSYDLRANLLKIDTDDYPHLVKTIKRFADKISSIIYRGKNNSDKKAI